MSIFYLGEKQSLEQGTLIRLETFVEIYEKVDSELCNAEFSKDNKFKLALEIYKEAVKE